MPVTIRPITDRDFFPWLAVYEGYGEQASTPITDQKALTVWSWMTDASVPVHGVVAVDDDGEVVGLAHFREFHRPLAAATGVHVDDLYVVESVRRQGVARQLLEHVSEQARAGRHGLVRWVVAPGDDEARALSEELGVRTEWTVYDRSL